jgi:hypothetical protein
MAIWLKQSTSATFQLGPFLDDTDGKTAETGLTIAYTSCYISKAGGSLGAKADTTNLTGTGDSLGYYDCVLGTGDTDTLGGLRVHVHVAGALPVWQDFLVVPANVYNSVVAGSDKLYVDAVELNSSTSAATTQALVATACITGKVFNDSGTYIPTNSGALVFYSDDVTEGTADHYNGRVVIFTSGAMLGQALAITDYEKVASYGKFTCSVATELPADDVTFVIV